MPTTKPNPFAKSGDKKPNPFISNKPNPFAIADEQPSVVTDNRFVPPEADKKNKEDKGGFLKNLTYGFKKTYEHDLPAAIKMEKVAQLRTREKTLEWAKNVKKEKDRRDSGGSYDINATLADVSGIDIAKAENMKLAIDKTVREKENVNRSISNLKDLISSGGVVNLGGEEGLTQKLDEDKTLSEIGVLIDKRNELERIEEEQGAIWNKYMSPILEKSASAASFITKEAQKLQEEGEKKYGSKMTLTTEDVNDIGSGIDYLAAQTGLAGGYMPMTIATAGLGMIDMEQGSIEGDIIRGMMDRNNMTAYEVFESGMEQQGAEIALEEGVKAGLLEVTGTVVTLLTPWARFGLKAGTTMAKSGFINILKKSFNVVSKLAISSADEAVTERMQTWVEIAADLKAQGYSNDEIDGMITDEMLFEPTVAGAAGALGLGGSSSIVKGIKDLSSGRIKTESANKQLLDGIQTDGVEEQSELAATETEKLVAQTEEIAINISGLDGTTPELADINEETTKATTQETQDTKVDEVATQAPVAEEEKVSVKDVQESDVFTKGEQTEKVNNSLSDKAKIVISNIKKSLSNRYSEVKVGVADSVEDFNEIAEKNGDKKSIVGGYYFPETNEIIYNPDLLDQVVGTHEAFHAVVSHEIFTALKIDRKKLTKQQREEYNEALKGSTKNMLDALERVLPKFGKVRSAFNNIKNQFQGRFEDGTYRDDDFAEEVLAEFSGWVASNKKELNPSIIAEIKRILNDLAKTLGIKEFFSSVSSDVDVLETIDAIAYATSEGLLLFESDVSSIKKSIPSTKETKSDIVKNSRLEAKKHAEALYLAPKEKFKSLKEVAKFISSWSQENKLFDDDIKNIDDNKIVNEYAKHIEQEIKAWEKVSNKEYIGFYNEDIPIRLNPKLQEFAKEQYGRNLTAEEVSLYHIVSAFASPSADPIFDSSKGLEVFHKFMTTGELSGFGDQQATIWATDKKGKRFDTGKPKFDDQGKPKMKQVSKAYAISSLEKVKKVIDYFKGDLKKSVDWLESVQSYEDMSKILGTPIKGNKAIKQHEYLTKRGGGFGVFGITGAKLGSYILNRVGEFSTVTKDMWYARTMARLSGEALVDNKGNAIKVPWGLTKEGIRKRTLADKAFSVVAKKLGTTPADVQQKIWDFEKRLYEKFGSIEKGGYASEGFAKKAKEIVEKSKEGEFSRDLLSTKGSKKNQGETYYHGTNKTFAKFKLGKLGSVWVTKDVMTTLPYGTQVRFNEKTGDLEQTNPRILQLNIQKGKFWDYKNEKDRDKLYNHISKNTLDVNKPTYKKKIKEGAWEFLENIAGTFPNYFKDLGYEGAYMTESGAENLAIFDAKRITIEKQLSQDEIGSKMIEGVEERIPAKSSKKTIEANVSNEVERIAGLDREVEDGATMNLDGTPYNGGGLVVPVVTINTTQEKLKASSISKFLSDNSSKIGSSIVKVGLYKFPKSDQVSIDLNIVIPTKYKKIALKFGKWAGQESLFNLDNFENENTGADGKNPKSFTDKEFKDIASYLEKGEMPSIVGEQLPAKSSKTIFKDVPEGESKRILDRRNRSFGGLSGIDAKSFVGKDGKEYIIIRQPNTEDVRINVYHSHQPIDVGVGVFQEDRNNLIAYASNTSIEVTPPMRRKGIATAIYDFAEEVTGKPVKKSDILSDEASKFWNNRELEKEVNLSPKSSKKRDSEVKKVISENSKDLKSAEATVIAVNKQLPKEERITDIEAKRAFEAIGYLEKKKVKSPPPTKEKTVKKTVATRAYEGEFREQVKRNIKNAGLDREVENQQESWDKVSVLVKDIGIEATLAAVRSGDIEGSARVFALGIAINITQEEMAKTSNEAEMSNLAQREADLVMELSEIGTKGGQQSSAFNFLYTNQDGLGFNAEKAIAAWQDKNDGYIPAKVEAKYKELEAKIKEQRERISELEKKAEEEYANGLIKDIADRIDNNKNNPKIKHRNAKKALSAIKNLRSKIKANAYSDAIGIVAIVDSGLAVIEESIKAGIEISNAIEAGVRYIRGKLKEKGVDTWEKEGKFRQDVEDAFTDSGVYEAAAKAKIKDDGTISIPAALIKELVEKGYHTIEDLTEAVKEIVIKDIPNITTREIRDAITGYGKQSNLNKEEIATKIRRMRRIGRIISALEDVANKKRPLRSGLKRDKLDAHERALNKKLRELMKELPVDERLASEQLKTATDALKQRLRNLIEDLETEIKNKERVPQSKRAIKDDAEITELRSKLKDARQRHEEMFKTEEFKAAKRLELLKRNTERRTEELRNRILSLDFSKKKKPKQVQDNELTRLKGKQLKLKEQFDKLAYMEELANRSTSRKIIDAFWDAWGLTRVLMATGEFSFVLIQGLSQTVAHPIHAAKGLKLAWKAMWSEKKLNDWLDNIKGQEFYSEMSQSKLAITTLHAELEAREELFYSDWFNMIWDKVIIPLKLINESSYQKGREFSPTKMIERAAVGFLDSIRVLRYLDGKTLLEAKGITFESNPAAYKEMADVVNTLTGRASLGKLEQISKPLTKIFFSPRNWASALKMTFLAPFYFGSLRAGAETKTQITVQQKMALADFSKVVGVTSSLVMLAALSLNNDDDDETGVSFDPTSTDFLKIKIGDTRIDPWGGKLQQIIFVMRMAIGSIHKNGEDIPLGTRFKSPTRKDLISQQAINKLAPSAAMINKYLGTGIDKDGIRRDQYGNEYLFSEEIKNNMQPIFWQTIRELKDDDGIDVLDSFLIFYAFFGGGVNNYSEITEAKVKKIMKGRLNIKTKKIKPIPKRPEPIDKKLEGKLRKAADKAGIKYIPPKKN